MLTNRTGLSTSDNEDHVEIGTPAVLSPVSYGGYPLWILVAAPSLLALLFLVLVILGIYYARKHRRKPKDPKEREDSLIPTGQNDPTTMQLTTSVESSIESAEAPSQKGHRMLRPSLSMDVEIPFHVKKQNVQPSASIPRWHSLHSPRPSLGALQPDIYRSSDSEDGGIVAPTEVGRLWFSLSHRKEEAELAVTLIRAKYLPGRGFSRGARDPFVKIFLLPDEENFKQSKVRKRTLSPKFNEEFRFKVAEEEVRNRCLRFTIYDVDKRKVRHCLGHAVIPLANVDLESNSVIWRDLEKSPQIRREGELQVSLMCNPYNNKLKVNICKVQNIQGLEGGEALVYVKVQLFHGHKLVKSKRTTARNVVGQSKSELIFHESLSFAVPARFYDSCYLQMVTYVSGGALLKDVALGKVTIGPFLFSRGEQLLHWQEMITNPRSIITRWHRLEPSI